METLKQLKTAIILLIIMTIMTGIIYPAAVTLIAQLFFPWKANGSMLTQNGNFIGSTLIGQSFTDDKYFWSRPSATTPYPYNAQNSSGSNMAPTNPAFIAEIKNRVTQMQQKNPSTLAIPVDLVTASASGLDPDISPFAAFYQAPRIANARHLPTETINQLIQQFITKRTFGLLGEPRVNVLQLNLALDQLAKNNEDKTHS